MHSRLMDGDAAATSEATNLGSAPEEVAACHASESTWTTASSVDRRGRKPRWVCGSAASTDGNMCRAVIMEMT